MPGATFLRGDRLTLRTVQPEDYSFLHEHWNHPSVRYGAPMATPFSEAAIENFVENADDAVNFLACRDGDPVGYAFLFDIDAEADHAELGYWVVEGERGNGYATAAAGLCLRHAFDDRGLHKVLARVFETNPASMRVLEKLGFEQEGCLREHRFVDGEHVDVHLYGLTAPEYREC